MTPDQGPNTVERNDCPKCEAPAGSACRTRGGKTATKYQPALRPHRCAARGTRSPRPR
ncbi:zinc finger domain-containing protein [Streptomyces brasiliensis]|uniref:zinc finger domain-containing protein n=1 Tax=Streptomyces brasiliensis TaxID=1954 RepID=UPI00403295CA